LETLSGFQRRSYPVIVLKTLHGGTFVYVVARGQFGGPAPLAHVFNVNQWQSGEFGE